MLEFLQTYWREIVEVVLLLATFLVALCKKKVKVYDSVSDLVLNILPGAINLAERELGAGNGKDKLNFVLNFVEEWLKTNYPEAKFASYKSLIIKQVEAILATPQKKG